MKKDYRNVGTFIGLSVGVGIGITTGGLGIAGLGGAIGITGPVAGAILGGGTGRIIGAELKQNKEE